MKNKIHLVMPMGGGGTRFGNKGFDLPKPLIELQGKPFFYWACQSVAKFVDTEDIVFVVLQEHVDNFSIDKTIKKYYPDALIHVIPHVLNGAVLTCKAGLEEINDDLPILFNDCDHAFIAKKFYDFCQKVNFKEIDGAMLTFSSDKPCYSYAQLDENGNVIKTVEKEVVSNEAICGAYYFRNKQIFNNAVNLYLSNCKYEEFFISGVYNEMIKSSNIIRTIQTDKHISFGTPEEYDKAINDQNLMELI